MQRSKIVILGSGHRRYGATMDGSTDAAELYRYRHNIDTDNVQCSPTSPGVCFSA
jgi:hypothetical protein